MEKDTIFSSQEFEQAYQNIKDRAILGKSGVEQPVPMFSRAGQKALAEKAAERAAARPQQIEKKNELEK